MDSYGGAHAGVDDILQNTMHSAHAANSHDIFSCNFSDFSDFLWLLIYWVEKYLPKIQVHLEPQNVTLFGNMALQM